MINIFKSHLIILLTILFLFVAPTFVLASSGWLIFYESGFKGKVIDAETREPIEGAVVVAIYNVIVFGPGGSGSSISDVQETLTDSNGEFTIPSNFFFNPWPFTLGGDGTEFIIFKPGYGSFPRYQTTPSGIKPIDQEVFFSKDVGSKGELRMWVKEEEGPKLKKFKVTFGIVELPKLKTREERRMSIPSPVHIKHSKQKQFIRLLNEDRKNRGLKGDLK